MRIKFVKQDCWIGLYWKDRKESYLIKGDWYYAYVRTYYLCLIPCFPIIWERVK